MATNLAVAFSTSVPLESVAFGTAAGTGSASAMAVPDGGSTGELLRLRRELAGGDKKELRDPHSSTGAAETSVRPRFLKQRGAEDSRGLTLMRFLRL